MPKAVFWYGVYCYAFAAFNLGLFALCVWFIVRHDQLANEYLPAATVLWTGALCAPLALFLAASNIWVVKAKNLKDPWAFHLTNIIVGIGICVMIPCALPLLIAWFHPAIRDYYRKPVNPP
jgi:hypothetical protein